MAEHASPHHGAGVPPADAAARWDERYGSTDYLFGVEPNRSLTGEVAGLSPGVAFDLACGEGRNAVWLATLGWRVTGVDISAVALRKAERLAAEAGVEVTFLRADLAQWAPPASSADLVVLSYLHLPADLRRRVHRSAAGALVPGGTVVVVAHHRDNLVRGVGGPQDPAVHYDEGTLRDDFAGLDVVRCEEVLRPVDTGGPATVDAVDLVFVATAAERG